MSALWVLPLVIVSIGVALVAVAMRSMAVAATDLAARSHQLTELGQQAAVLRADVDAVAGRARALSWRGDAPATGR